VLQSVSAATDLDLISYLKAIPDARMRRGVRIPAWYLLLVAVLGILSKCESLRDLERCARRHHAVLTDVLGPGLKRPPSDSAFRYFFLQVDVNGVCAAIRDWTIAQIPGGATDLDQLICDGKTLRGSIEPTSGGGSAFIAKVTLYYAALGVAIAKACYATGENHERAVLQKLLGEMDLEGVLIQADALHTQRPFFNNSRSRGRLPGDGQSQPEDPIQADRRPAAWKAQDPFHGSRSRDRPWAVLHLGSQSQGGTRPHQGELAWHKLNRGSDRHRNPRRQAIQGHAQVHHQPAHYPRGIAASGERALEPGELALDPGHSSMRTPTATGAVAPA
jgi:hypothetical protein